jgi:hypothetical protein
MLTDYQNDILKILALSRNDSSYFAGSSVLNYDKHRGSEDFDIFHDDDLSCIKAYMQDIGILESQGYAIVTTAVHDKSSFREAIVSKDLCSTKIQWIRDSAYRFFPLVQNETFGFCLNPVDLAINKILAFAGRFEIRDYYDICLMADANEPVCAYIWAACDKDPYYTPFKLLELMSWHSQFREDDFFSIISQSKFPLIKCKELLLGIIEQSRKLFEAAPCSEYGTLYLNKSDHKVYFPDKEDFLEENFIRHKGSFRGLAPVFPKNGATHRQTCGIRPG